MSDLSSRPHLPSLHNRCGANREETASRCRGSTRRPGSTGDEGPVPRSRESEPARPGFRARPAVRPAVRQDSPRPRPRPPRARRGRPDPLAPGSPRGRPRGPAPFSSGAASPAGAPRAWRPPQQQRLVVVQVAAGPRHLLGTLAMSAAVDRLPAPRPVFVLVTRAAAT